MKSLKSLGLAAALIGMTLGGASFAQAPAPAPATTSPTATATTPDSGQAPATATTTAPAAAPAAVEPAATAAPAASKIPEFNKPTPGIGQPTEAISLQPQVTDIGLFAQKFDSWLLVIITIISLFVLGLLFWVAVRYNRRANPTPSRTSHNTTIEIIWTVAPVLILLCIAVPSIKLLARQYSTPKPDLTVKVIGHQWYWSYQYPDNGDFEVVSNILTDAQDKAKGEPRQLGVDARMVVPVDSVIKIITTSDDVIHSFAVPAFWTKMDAVPGRLNETWFKVNRTGLYYGQCSELCGARHGYMPIAVDVVTKEQFAQWVAANGGTMPGAAKPASSDATANSPITNPSATTANPEPGAGASTTATENSTAAATPASQSATN
ncbi:cytochrome c oxidase subunit II [Sphingomonas sp. CGMCC 1.13654]|uniref:Cytochrome c oxidase subunit 2 n=1 Tax=Sphingomonas chungangi TaxID=2683589 RepID=A0A838L5C8_9SPHN|nr:cytochrome c oxidase subunit II [Sphingomonas chungangi]MBA2934693.1 cytochrome c oxidase subunit II [Sphingomonas chungangi]MVW58004.1 cytochrome c oxidase subunit II [Sphingomonas chungangi]